MGVTRPSFLRGDRIGWPKPLFIQAARYQEKRVVEVSASMRLIGMRDSRVFSGSAFLMKRVTREICR